jgi:hypothetical protein
MGIKAASLLWEPKTELETKYRLCRMYNQITKCIHKRIMTKISSY